MANEAGGEPKGLLDIESTGHENIPLTARLSWLCSTVSKFVKGGTYLLAGEAGIGKSTLALQIALDLGVAGAQTVYMHTEQSAADLKERAQLLVSGIPKADRELALSNVKPVDWHYEHSQLGSFLAREVLGREAPYTNAVLVVLDSIQGHGLSSAATKQFNHIYAFCREAKAAGIATLLVGHVTKRGGIAGPKTLEHNVDCILYFRKAFRYRPLFVPKNRFGPARLKPIPLEMDRKTTELRVSAHSETLSAVARSFLGKPHGDVEAQAAVALPTYGSRGRITAPGLPKKEVEQLLSCLSQLEEVDIEDLSFTIQCRLPGERVYRALLGLPLAMALLSSYLQREIPSHHMYLGELDLQKRVREVPDVLIEELWESVEDGTLSTPLRLYCPKESASLVREGLRDATVVACETLEDVVFKTWPDLAPR